MYSVYILYSTSLDKYYIGFTAGSVGIRLSKHLANNKGFTGKAKDWKIVRIENYGTKEDAMHREIEIKNWKSRRMIEKLISSTE